MERQPERLVERIFSRPRSGPNGRRPVPSLFQPVKPSPPSQTQSISARGATPLPTPGPKVNKRYPVGLDFGAASLKWVQLGQTAGKTRIIELGCRPLSLSPGLSEKAGHFQRLEVLKKVVNERRLKGEAVLSLPLEDVSLRLLKMTAVPDAEMEQAIRWQVEQTLPAGVSYDALVVDYLPLREFSGEPKSHVLAVCAPRQKVMDLIACARETGLRPVAVEIDPFAFAHYLIYREPAGSRQATLLIHLGAAASTFSVVIKGQLAMARSILTTGRSLTQAAADFLRIPREEAEMSLQTHGLAPAAPGDAPVAVGRALASPLENLVVDILQAFNGFSHQVGGSSIRFDRVCLGGGVSRLPGLGPWLQARLGAPVELANPLALFPLDESLTGLEPWEKLSSSFNVAMGLALREMGTP